MAGSGLLGRLSVVITSDTRQFQRSLQHGAHSVKKLRNSVDILTETVGGRFIGVLAAASVGLAQLGVRAMKMGAEFEDAITVLSAIQGNLDGVTDSTNDAVKAQGDFARVLGKETVFTATEAAVAMQSFARAGFKTNEIISATRDALNFAKANATTMTNATTLLAATMSQFNLDATQSTRIVDTFTAAMQNSLFDVESLTVSMRYAGSIASVMGMSIEQTTAALSLFRDLGLEGSTVGTQFRQALISLANPTKKAEAVLKKYKLTADDLNVTLHGFEEVMLRIGKANMTLGEVTTLVSKRASGSISTISRNMVVTAEVQKEMQKIFGDLTVEGNKFRQMMDEIDEAQGTALTRSTYEQATDNVKSQFDILKSVATETALIIFDMFSGTLQNTFVFLQESITATNAVLSNFIGSMQRAGQSINFPDPSEFGAKIAEILIVVINTTQKGIRFILSNKDEILFWIKAIANTLALIVAMGLGKMVNNIFLLFIGQGAKVIGMMGTIKTVLGALWGMLVGLGNTMNGLFLKGQAGTAAMVTGVNRVTASFAALRAMIATTSLTAGKLTAAIAGIAAATFALTAVYKWIRGIADESERLLRLAKMNQEGTKLGVEEAQSSIGQTNVEKQKTAIQLEQDSLKLEEEIMRNYPELLNERGKLLPHIKEEIEALKNLDEQKAKDLQLNNEIISTTADNIAMTAKLAVFMQEADKGNQRAGRGYDDLTKSLDQITQEKKKYGRELQDLIDLEKEHVEGTELAQRKFSDWEEGYEAVGGKIEDILKLDEEEVKKQFEKGEGYALLEKAISTTEAKINEFSTAQRGLQGAVTDGRRELERIKTETRLAQLQQERYNETINTGSSELDEYARKLATARDNLNKFLDRQRLFATDESWTEYTTKITQRFAKANELFAEVRNLNASLGENQEEDFRIHLDTISDIFIGFSREVQQKTNSLAKNLIKDRKKISGDLVSDVEDEFNQREGIITRYFKDYTGVITASQMEEMLTARNLRDFRLKQAKETIKDADDLALEEAKIKREHAEEELRIENEYKAHHRDLKEHADYLSEEALKIKNLKEAKIIAAHNERLLQMVASSSKNIARAQTELIDFQTKQSIEKFIASTKSLEKAGVDVDKMIADFTEAELKSSNMRKKAVLDETGVYSDLLGTLGNFTRLIPSLASFSKLLLDIRKHSDETGGSVEDLFENLQDSELSNIERMNVLVDFFADGAEEGTALARTIALLTRLFKVFGDTLGETEGRMSRAVGIFKDLQHFSKPFEMVMQDNWTGSAEDAQEWFDSEVYNEELHSQQASGNKDLAKFDALRKAYFQKEVRKQLEDDRSFYEKLVSTVGNLGKAFGTLFKKTATASGEASKSIGIFQKLGTSLSSVAGKITGKAALGGGAAAALGIFAIAIVALIAKIASVIFITKSLVKNFKKLANVIKSTLVPAYDALIGRVTEFAGGFDITKPYEKLLSIVSTLASEFKELSSSQSGLSSEAEKIEEEYRNNIITLDEYNEKLRNLGGAGAGESSTGRARDLVKESFDEARAFAKIIGDVAGAVLSEFANQIPSLMVEIANSAPKVVAALMQFYPQIISGVFSALPNLLQKVSDAIINNLPSLLTGVTGFLTTALPNLFSTLASISSTLAPQVVSFISSLAPAVWQGLRSIGGSIGSLLGNVIKQLPSILSNVMTTSGELLSTMTTLALEFLYSLQEILPELFEVFTEKWPEVSARVMSAFTLIFTQLVIIFVDLFGIALQNSDRISAAFVKFVFIFITELQRNMPFIVGGLIRAFGNLIIGIAEQFVNFITGGLLALVQTIVDLFKNPMDWDSEGRSEANAGTRDRAGSAWDDVVETAKNVWDGITFWNDTPSVMKVGTAGAMAGFAQGDYFAAAKRPVDLLAQVMSMQGLFGSAGGSGGNGQPIDIAIMAEGRVLDAVQIRALDRGNAPRMEKRMQRQSGINVGFNRGRFSQYGV